MTSHWRLLAAALPVLVIAGCESPVARADWILRAPVVVGPARPARFIAPGGFRPPPPERPYVRGCVRVAPGYSVGPDLSVRRDADGAAILLRARYVTDDGDTLRAPRLVMGPGPGENAERTVCYEAAEYPLPASFAALVVSASDTVTVDGVTWGVGAVRQRSSVRAVHAGG